MKEGDLGRFLNSVEVQQIRALAQLWDGVSVKGDLLALAKQYHHLAVRYLSAGQGEIVPSSDDDLGRLSAQVRQIWRPFRDEIWPMRPRTAVRTRLKQIEEDDEWHWLAVDSKWWGLEVDPYDVSIEPRASEIDVTFSAVVAQYNRSRRGAEEVASRGGVRIIPSFGARLLAAGWSWSAAAAHGRLRAEVYGDNSGTNKVGK